VHVDHALRVGLLGLVCRSCASLRIFGEALGEADLAGVHEVPALVLVVMVSIEALLAEVAKIVGRNMRLASVVGDHVALKRTLNTACLAFLFRNVFSWRDEVSECLELIARHCAVSAALQSQILLEMRIQVLLEGQVAHEAHSANAAVELHALENLSLGCFGEFLEGLGVCEGGAVRVVVPSVVVACRLCSRLVCRSGLVINKISKRQLPSFIERSERL